MTSTIEAPPRTEIQRLEALDLANGIRRRRSEMKQALKAGDVSLVAIIADPPVYARTMSVFDLLRSAPGLGRTKADKLMRATRIAPSKTLGGLTTRQRQELALGIRRRWPALAEAA